MISQNSLCSGSPIALRNSAKGIEKARILSIKDFQIAKVIYKIGTPSHRDFPDDDSLASPGSLCVKKVPQFITDSGSLCRTICSIERLWPPYLLRRPPTDSPKTPLSPVSQGLEAYFFLPAFRHRFCASKLELAWAEIWALSPPRNR